jgi:hypothetical protein
MDHFAADAAHDNRQVCDHLDKTGFHWRTPPPA